MLKAVIFDMDGVIIDSEPMHARAAVLALQKYDINISIDYAYHFIGTTTYVMCRNMVEDFNLNITPEQLLNDNIEMKNYLLSKEGYSGIPYILDVMKDLKEHDMKLIIASSSSPEAIEDVMNALLINPYFHGYVSGTMVANPKPAPDIFLEAARRLGVAPENCIVIEDSLHGITAANAAGMASIGFINPNSGNQDLSKATMLIEGFDEIDYNFIQRVHQYAHMEPATILTTENFILRELSLEDIDSLHQICLKPEIHVFLDNFDTNPAVEREKHKAYIQNIYHYYGYGLWGVYFKDNGRLAGRCGVELKMLDGEEIYEIGYLLDSSYQGQGYAREFVTETIHYCFDKLDIPRILAVIDKHNIRSIRLAEQMGMKNIGECTRNQRDCYKYEICRYS